MIGRDDSAGINYGGHRQAGTIQHLEQGSDYSAVNTALLTLEATFRAMPFAVLVAPGLSIRVRILGVDAERVAPGVAPFGYLNIRYRSCTA